MNKTSHCVQATLLPLLLAARALAQPAPVLKPLGGKPPAAQAKAAQLPTLRVETEKHPDGSTKKETPYVDGKIHGEVKEFWPGGKQLKSLTRYEKGQR